jgi:subtilisin family serine protease
MKSSRVAAIAFLGLWCVAGTTYAADASKSVRRVARPVAGEYIVTLRDDAVGRDQVSAVAYEMALRGKGRVLAVYQHGLRGYGVALTDAEARKVAQDPRVEAVEENAYGEYSYDVETYPDATFNWHLNRIDQHSTIGVNTTYAYGWTSTGSNVDVYVLDSGIQAGHTEFSTVTVTPGVDYAGVDGWSPTNPCGGFVNRYNGGHGTAVASLIAGRTVGVARGARLIPVKVATCDPTTPYTQLEPEYRLSVIAVLYGMDWIIAQANAAPSRRAVANMSFFFTTPQATECPNSNCMPAMENNIRNMLNNNIVVVAAANNQNANRCATQTPARMGYGGMYDPGNQPTWPFVITVGGVDRLDQRHTCASCNQAAEGGSNFGPCVGFYAPAKEIRAAHIASSTAYRTEQNWLTQAIQEVPQYAGATIEQVSTGTSFAAPIVSGMAARLLQTFPSMTVRQVWNHLYSTATVQPNNFDGDNIARNDRLVFISVNQ